MRVGWSSGPYETYLPKPRQALFHSIPAVGSKMIKGAIGGLGGGKTTCCEQELIELCLRMPGGISVAIRKSISGRAELSVLADLKRMLVPGGHAKWVASENHFRFANGHQLFVLPADDWERMGSAELCAFYIQEAQEISYSFFSALSARLRHKAAYINDRPYWRGLFDARGIKRSHWINKEFVEKAWNVDTPQSERAGAVNPNFVYQKFKSEDNDSLPPGYVDELRREHAGDIPWLKVFIEGEIGFDIEGRPVYGDAFDSTVHVAPIAEDPTLPILRGWDFGYRAPGVVFSQYTRSGRLLVLRELVPINLSTDSLIDRVVALQAAEFPRRNAGSYLDFGDDQGREVQSSSEYFDIEKIEERLETQVNTRKGAIEIGLNVVRKLMLSSTKSQGRIVSRFAVDPSCETLIDALGGAYFYPEDKPDKPPIKGGSYVAVSDGLRYTAQLVVEEGTIEASGPTHFSSTSSFASY